MEENPKIEEIVEEAWEEMPQPITTKHVKKSSISIATDPISEVEWDNYDSSILFEFFFQVLIPLIFYNFSLDFAFMNDNIDNH